MSIGNIVAVASPSFSQSEQLVDELRKLPCKVVLNPGREIFSEAALIDFIGNSGAAIAIIGRERIQQSTLAALPALMAIAKYGVGVDNIDFTALQSSNIKFGHTEGVNRSEVAVQVLGFAIGHFRNLFTATQDMKKGLWIKDGGRDINSLKVGIIGFGHVGTAVAEILRPFQPEITFADILDKSAVAPKYNARQTGLKELLESSDLISLHVPLTDRTNRLIDSEALSLMKHDALLVNTARGEIVDFNAVVAAVAAKKLGGFASDVYTIEPVDLTYLGREKNLYFTPHIAANSTGAILKMGRSAISWVQLYLEGH